MTTVIALLRAVNVGRRRVAMADLRATIEAQGHQRVRTLLDSGNVVFDSPLSPARLAAQLRLTLEQRFGFTLPLSVITAQELNNVVLEHPWARQEGAYEGRYASRQLVGFAAQPGALAQTRPLLSRDWGEESLVLGAQAAWMWCPEGIDRSPLAAAFMRTTGDRVTARNWSTVLVLQAAAERRH